MSTVAVMVAIRVLVPHDEGVTALAGVPGVTALRYDVNGELPAAAAEPLPFGSTLFGAYRLTSRPTAMPAVACI